MIRPDDESKSFQRRWNTLMRILLVESSVKLVGRTAMDYADWDDGTAVFTGNERMARITGYSERTVRTSWTVLRALGVAERYYHGSGGKRQADAYNLVIPSNWYNKPVLGPNEGRFRCIHCGKVFNPSTSALNIEGDGRVTWSVYKMALCPEKKGRNAPASCFSAWIRANGRAWSDLDNEEVWKLFREARGDDW